MHHLSTSHLHINLCSICPKFVIKGGMLFYFAAKRKDAWNDLSAFLDHGVTTRGQPTSKLIKTASQVKKIW